jgi:hypothetical protein
LPKLPHQNRGVKADTYLLDLVHVEMILKEEGVMKSNMYE